MKMRKEFAPAEIGKGRMIREGERVAVLSFGPIGNYVLEAARALEEEGIQIGHFDMRFAKPLDTALIDEVLDSYESIITIEDGTRLGGFGSAVAEYVAEQGAGIPVRIMGEIGRASCRERRAGSGGSRRQAR